MGSSGDVTFPRHSLFSFDDLDRCFIRLGELWGSEIEDPGRKPARVPHTVIALPMAAVASQDPLPDKIDRVLPCRAINKSGTRLAPLRNCFPTNET